MPLVEPDDVWVLLVPLMVCAIGIPMEPPPPCMPPPPGAAKAEPETKSSAAPAASEIGDNIMTFLHPAPADAVASEVPKDRNDLLNMQRAFSASPDRG